MTVLTMLRPRSATATTPWRLEGLLAAVVGTQALYATALHFAFPGMTALDPAALPAAAMAVAALLLPLVVMLPLLAFGRIVVHPPAGSAISAFVTETLRLSRDPQRWRNGLPVVALLVPFTALFVHLKVNIPAILPFAFDEAFSALDRALFLGRLPHEWLGALGADPLALFLTNVAYTFWFFVTWAMFLGFAFARQRSALRSRYLLAFFLVWFVEGNVLALLLSSAGPCFFGSLGLSPDPYAPLMAALRAANETYPVWSLATQEMLWNGHIGQGSAAGISAMPSLHNGTTILMALAARHFGRGPSLGFGLYALWIFVGSVALGWHYAVDGIVAALVTAMIWIVAGRMAGRLHPAPRPPRPASS